MKAYCYVDIGPGKANCDDRVLINNSVIAAGLYSIELPDDRTVSLAVADGVGGSKAGYYAATQAVSALSESLLPTDLSVQSVIHLINEANWRIIALSNDDIRLSGMATTLSGLCHEGNHWFLYHVGNTRVYVWAFGSLNQLTEDHTWIRKMQLVGFGEGELSQSARQSEINACLGGGNMQLAEKLQVLDVSNIIGDAQRILITSDGLHDYIQHSALEASMEGIGDVEDYFRQAIDFARESGSKDDISILMVDL